MAGVRAGLVYTLGHARFRDAEFTGTYYATPGHEHTARKWAQERFARYLAACGHDIGPASVLVEERNLTATPEYEGLDLMGPLTAGEARFVRAHEPPPGWGSKPKVLTASARVLAPVRSYPRCGDWMCADDADWAEADPVDHPARYAGVAAEQGYIRQLLDTVLPRDLVDEAMASYRRRAGGMPLWTIDIRPPAPARM